MVGLKDSCIGMGRAACVNKGIHVESAGLGLHQLPLSLTVDHPVEAFPLSIGSFDWDLWKQHQCYWGLRRESTDLMNPISL